MRYRLPVIALALLCASCTNDVTAPMPAIRGDVALRSAVVPGEIEPAITGGASHTCALTDQGAVICWGDSPVEVPEDLEAMVASHLVSGHAHACAVLAATGEVRCWGSGSEGQLDVPPGLSGVVRLAAGSYHTCALRSDGTVICWGGTGSGSGEHDGGKIVDAKLTPGASSPPPDLADVRDIAAGHFHSCAVTGGEAVVCWGTDVFGYGILSAPEGTGPITQIFSGDHHVCLLLETDRKVTCWGGNNFNQTIVPFGVGVAVQITAGGYHTCALKSDGTAVCWGRNGDSESIAPEFVEPVSKLGAGTHHSCAISVAGRVACWGSNGSGQATPPPGLILHTQKQRIVFVTKPPQLVLVGGEYAVAAEGGPSGNPVVFSSLTPTTCTVDDDIVSLVGRGKCVIAADQAGGPGFFPADQAYQSFDVFERAAITFTSTPPHPAFVGDTYEVRAVVSGSETPVTFATATLDVCAVRGTIVEFLAPGSCMVFAKHPGGELLLPADPATQTIEVVESAGATPPGENVQVTPIDQTTGEPSPATVSFGEVTGGGETTVTSGTIGAGGGPPPPANFRLGNPPTYFDISTTATFTGVVTICISYEGVSYPNESRLKLLHLENDAWTDITTVLDKQNKIICGETSSLSPFVVAQELLPFAGFFRPVENRDAQGNYVLNRVRAGSAVPLKFSVGGNLGLGIVADGFPRSAPIACDPAATVDRIDETATAGASGLMYDPKNDQYVYVWKTESAWRGCRQLTLRLIDGSDHSVSFLFMP